ncbi:MAG TPA: adenylate/guanylate cyclase domain-containing protein [Leptolyngbyaceae cyanobacterium]
MAANTLLDTLISKQKSCWPEIAFPLEPYELQRNCFMLDRLQLEGKIMLIVGCTIPAFFFCTSMLQGQAKFSALVIGAAVEASLLACLALCRTSFGRKYPQIVFLGLSWAITCVVQIAIAFFGYYEPETSLWNLVFLSQATLVPVLWPLHLISQLGAIFCYFSLYSWSNPNFQTAIFSYTEQWLYLFWTCAICNLSVYLYERLKQNEFSTRRELEIAREKSEQLLLNVLPESIAERLKQESNTIADCFNEVSVLFADIVGFTELSSRVSAAELVQLLNQIFTMFDQLAEQHGVEKIKTIGDAYMVVAGLPEPRKDHAFAIADMALDMQKTLADFNQKNGQSFRIRIGISTGPAVAGVIGLKKFAYDLWGDTVNTASRMESHGIAGYIQVCEAFYRSIKDKYLFEERGKILVKGKGEMTTYLLKEKLKEEFRSQNSEFRI